MRKAAQWLGVAAVAAAIVPLTFVQQGCQGTCASNTDCGSGSYCALSTGDCLLAQAVGFCKPLPTSCPPVNAAVCGCDGKQYTNACEAAQASVSAANDGACTTVCGGASNVACKDKTTYCHFMDGVCAAGNAIGTCDPIPTTCAGAAASPVCGCDGKTYASLCEAQLAGTSVAAQGACTCSGSGDGGTACESDKFCDYATGACLGPYPTGTCTPRPTSCPPVVSQVCGCDGKTYTNACEAAKAGTATALTGPCTAGGAGGGSADAG